MNSIRLFFLFLLTIPLSMLAQEIKVKSFEPVNDIVSENDWQKDLDGDYCALVKVRMIGDIERVEGNIVGNVIDRGSEKWIFLTTGTKSFRLYIQDKLPLDVNCSNYTQNELVSKHVYVLTLLNTQKKHTLSDPLILSDSAIIKRNKEWFFVHFNVHIPFKSAILQSYLSQALFQIDDNSLELAFRRFLTKQSEFKSFKSVKSWDNRRQISFDVNISSFIGNYATIEAQYTREWPEKGSMTNIIKRKYSCIFDTEKDKILSISDVFVPETTNKLKELMDTSNTYNLIQTSEGVTVRLYKKGKNGMPIDKCIKALSFNYGENMDVLTESFRNNTEISIDNYKNFIKKKIDSNNKRHCVTIDSISVELVSHTNVFIEKTEVDINKLFDIACKLPKFSSSDGHSLEKHLLSVLNFNNIHNVDEDTIKATFVVLPDGKVTDQQIKEMKSTPLENDLLRAIVSMSNWNPGINSDLYYRLFCEIDVYIRKRDTISISKYDSDNNEKVFDIVEQMPSYPGGDVEMNKFISKHMKYPYDAEENGIQGRCICSFIVEKDGSISNINTTKTVSQSLDKEAIRLIKAMPKWIPGKQNGNVVRVKYTIPITFRL